MPRENSRTAATTTASIAPPPVRRRSLWRPKNPREPLRLPRESPGDAPRRSFCRGRVAGGCGFSIGRGFMQGDVLPAESSGSEVGGCALGVVIA